MATQPETKTKQIPWNKGLRGVQIKKAKNCLELWDIDNGKTLCEDCHSQTDNYKVKGWLK